MKTGILDKTRLFANVLMLLLVALNIFFSIQYTQNLGFEDRVIEEQAIRTEQRIEVARFMKLFIEEVLRTSGAVSFEARVRLENDVRQLGDVTIVEQWDKFVNSKDGEEAQRNVILLMSLLSNKMVQ
jgi:hypothetical protein